MNKVFGASNQHKRDLMPGRRVVPRRVLQTRHRRPNPRLRSAPSIQSLCLPHQPDYRKIITCYNLQFVCCPDPWIRILGLKIRIRSTGMGAFQKKHSDAAIYYIAFVARAFRGDKSDQF